MTDIEILRSVGISTYLYDKPSDSLRSMIVKAMKLAREDATKLERERCAKILNDRAKLCAEKADLSDDEKERIDLRATACDFSVIEQEIHDGG